MGYEVFGAKFGVKSYKKNIQSHMHAQTPMAILSPNNLNQTIESNFGVKNLNYNDS